jgi:EmrB/QacA subfamily drug resistance transporter
VTSDRRPGGQLDRSDMPPWYPWVAMGVFLIGSYMVILDVTIVNVALPQIAIDLGRESGIEWVVTAYLIAIGIAQPATAWAADRYGRKRIFTISLFLFGLGSLLAALSPNLNYLIAFRILQGAGGGAMMPVGLAMIYELFPPERRGTALGIWALSAMAAPAVGPTLGGYIVTAADWRWLFFVNVPIGVIGVIAAVILLRDFGFREKRPFDLLGFGLAAGGLVSLLLAFSESNEWGWGSPQIVGLLVLGSALLSTFVFHALRTDHPLIQVRMFAVPTFSITIIIIWVTSLMLYSRLVFIPLQLETLRDMTAFKVGLILTPSAIAAMIASPLAGRLTDKIGPRYPIVAGIISGAFGAWFLGHLELDTSVYVISAFVALQGFGMGLAMTPNTVAAMASVQDRFAAQAATVRSLNMQVAASFGVAILSTIVVSQIGVVSAHGLTGADAQEAQDAYNSVFLIALGVLLAGLVLALFLPGRAGMRSIQRQRSAEFNAPASSPSGD